MQCQARAPAAAPVDVRNIGALRKPHAQNAQPPNPMQRAERNLDHWTLLRDRALGDIERAGAAVTSAQHQAFETARRMVQRFSNEIAELQADAEHARRHAEQRHLFEPPDLQALVERCGGFDKVSAEDWVEYERQRDAWQQRIAHGDHWASKRKRRSYAERK